jgi:hypothetical protein
VIVGHIMGLPVEESVLTLAAGGTGITALTVVTLAWLRRALRVVRRRSPTTSG